MNPKEIVATRHLLKLGQIELASLMGVHPMTVSRWERGRVSPTAYQSAMLTQFKLAAKNKTIRTAVAGALIATGIMSALYLLLNAARKEK
jgi:putative transcriptional regulator